jgi:hypothetical protein
VCAVSKALIIVRFQSVTTFAVATPGAANAVNAINAKASFRFTCPPLD